MSFAKQELWIESLSETREKGGGASKIMATFEIEHCKEPVTWPLINFWPTCLATGATA